MDKQLHTCLLVSDFNLQNFAGYAASDPAPPAVDPIPAPPGEPLPALLDTAAAHWRDPADAAVIWTQPHSVSPAFNALLMYEPVPVREVLREVDAYCGLLAEASARVRFAFVPSWVIPSYRGLFGVLDMKAEVGLTNTLMRMNLRLAENLEKVRNAHLLNAGRWIERAGAGAFNPKLWYLGKIPFGNEVFREAVRDIKAALAGMLGRARKLIIVDLDDTLWGGLVGELGWENLVLGGHHHAGEAYADFQRGLKSLQNRGILLAIASKNEERTALEAIGKHPEMVLRPDDFAAWRIDWRDKAGNILELLHELNLGPQSAVFIDDNPAERARVRESLPEVLVPEWPADPVLYPSALLSLRCFDLPSLSREDLSRTAMVLSERERRELKKNLGSPEEWLRQLSIRVRIEALHPANLQRAAQLLNKTNQMNLSTRRMSEAELMAWAGPEHRRLWTARVSDRFGDAGLTGLVSLEIREGKAQLVDFVLSCRVLGRKIEESLLATAIAAAQASGVEALYARYLPTAKNKPCLDFFESLAPRFLRQGELFVRNIEHPFPVPDHIELVRNCSGQ
jgi:FkbH-like protein